MAGFLPSRTGRFRGEIDAKVLDTHLSNSITELQPQPAAQLQEGKTMATTGNAATAVQEVMQEHVRLMTEIHAASIETLKSSLARQRDTMSGAVGKIAANVDRQTDDFLAMMGQFSNDL